MYKDIYKGVNYMYFGVFMRWRKKDLFNDFMKIYWFMWI
jgi:hypothetical protein